MNQVSCGKQEQSAYYKHHLHAFQILYEYWSFLHLLQELTYNCLLGNTNRKHCTDAYCHGTVDPHSIPYGWVDFGGQAFQDYQNRSPWQIQSQYQGCCSRMNVALYLRQQQKNESYTVLCF